MLSRFLTLFIRVNKGKNQAKEKQPKELKQNNKN